MMLSMKSIGNMIRQLNGLAGTVSLSVRDTEFVESVVQRTKAGTYTAQLSEAQVKWITDLYNRHFGDG